jgi:hypothetical protein
MPRIRTLKPEHRQHRKIGPLSDRAYRLWVSMILEADDHGRLVCDADQLRALTWPYHPKVNAANVEDAILELARLKLVRLYIYNDVRYADFPSWSDHQRIQHPSIERLPCYQEDTAANINPPESSESLLNPPEKCAVLGRERKGMERNGREAASMTLEELVSKLKSRPAYARLDVQAVAYRCQSWCETNRKALTERRLVNWLNGDATNQPVSGRTGASHRGIDLGR